MKRPLLVNLVLWFSIFSLAFWTVMVCVLLVMGKINGSTTLGVLIAFIPGSLAMVGLWRMQRWGADLLILLSIFTVAHQLINESRAWLTLLTMSTVAIMIHYRKEMKPYKITFEAPLSKPEEASVHLEKSES